MNLSDVAVKAAYTIRCIPFVNTRDTIEWSDPDHIVHFSKFEGPDYVWGNEDFYNIEELKHNHIFYNKDTVVFELELTIYSHVNINDQPLTKLVEGADSENDLLKIAQNDISKIVIKAAGRPAGEEKFLQDRLLHARVPGNTINLNATDRKKS